PGSWARSRSRPATSPPGAWTPFARSRRRERWTSPPRSCSFESAGWRSTFLRRRPSARLRSTPKAARESLRRQLLRSAPSCSPRSLGDSHWVLEMELRALAQRRLLSAAPAPAALARVLRPPLRHRRGKRDLLPPAAGERRRELGAREPAGVPLRREDEPLRHAHQAPARPVAEPGGLLL